MRLLVVAIALLFGACRRAAAPLPAAPLPPPAGVRVIGRLQAAALTESSGLAASRTAGRYWTHNDSGGRPRLYPISEDGSAGLPVQVVDAAAVDWEDIAAFDTPDGPRLLIADTGDNKRLRLVYQLYIVPEPEPGARVAVERLVAFSYPRGPNDCEGVAVLPGGQSALVATKGEVCTVYEISLAADKPTTGAVPRGPALRPAVPVATLPFKRVTALAMDRPGERLAFLAGREVFAFRRAPAESWGRCLSGPPHRYELPRGWSGEALCYTLDSRALLFTAEGVHSPVLRLELPPETGND